MRLQFMTAVGISIAGIAGIAGCGSSIDDEIGTPLKGADASAGGENSGTGGDVGSPAGGSSSGGKASGSGGSTTGSGGVAAGSGGSAAGGTAGAAGTVGTAGKGGASGGSSGAAGTGGAVGDGGTPFVPNPGTVGVVVCQGNKACTTSEVCCYTEGTTFPAKDATYTCSSKPCTGGDLAVSCDGREDCLTGKSCCRVDSGGGLLGGGTTSFTCRDSCTSTVVQCGGPDNCPDRTVCCETVGALGTVALKTECSKTCAGSGKYLMCHSADDCPANAPTCVESTSMPGFHRCQ